MRIKGFTVQCAIICICLCSFGEATAEIECSHPTLPEGLAAMVSTDTVLVTTVPVDCWPSRECPAAEGDNFYYAFEPKNSVPTAGLIIHPGGNCDPRAYAPMAQAIASEGYLVAIIPMPGCTSVWGWDRTARVIADFGGIQKWTLAGHSVGGASITQYTYEYGGIDGLVMLAATGHNNYPLDNSHNVRVLSLYGGKDAHLTLPLIMEMSDDLPLDTMYMECEGCNHTQYGWLDPTPYPEYFKSDGPADVTYQEQQDIIVEATLNFMQGDTDTDGVPDVSDNCSLTPNGQTLGTCLQNANFVGNQCTSGSECSSCAGAGVCSMDQGDADSDGLGDACDAFPDEVCAPSGRSQESWLCGANGDPAGCCTGKCGLYSANFFDLYCIDHASDLGYGACYWEDGVYVYNGFTNGTDICCNFLKREGTVCP